MLYFKVFRFITTAVAAFELHCKINYQFDKTIYKILIEVTKIRNGKIQTIPGVDTSKHLKYIVQLLIDYPLVITSAFVKG